MNTDQLTNQFVVWRIMEMANKNAFLKTEIEQIVREIPKEDITKMLKTDKFNELVMTTITILEAQKEVTNKCIFSNGLEAPYSIPKELLPKKMSRFW